MIITVKHLFWNRWEKILELSKPFAVSKLLKSLRVDGWKSLNYRWTMNDLDGGLKFRAVVVKLLQSNGNSSCFQTMVMNYDSSIIVIAIDRQISKFTAFCVRKSFFDFDFNNKIILRTFECLTHRQIEAVMNVHYSLLHCRQLKRDGTRKNRCVEILTKVSLLHSITDPTYTRIFPMCYSETQKSYARGCIFLLSVCLLSWVFSAWSNFSPKPQKEASRPVSENQKSNNRSVRDKNHKVAGVCCCDNLSRTLMTIVDAKSVAVIWESLRRKVFWENREHFFHVTSQFYLSWSSLNERKNCMNRRKVIYFEGLVVFSTAVTTFHDLWSNYVQLEESSFALWRVFSNSVSDRFCGLVVYTLLDTFSSFALHLTN